jgi:hypothetical protein
MKTTEIKKELQDNQISHAKESIGKELEQLWTMNAVEQKRNLAPTTKEDMENH